MASSLLSKLESAIIWLEAWEPPGSMSLCHEGYVLVLASLPLAAPLSAAVTLF